MNLFLLQALLLHTTSALRLNRVSPGVLSSLSKFNPVGGHCSHYVHLREKLSQGKAITMLSVGSSITGVHGGCTAPVPGLATQEQCPKCCGAIGGQWGDQGWARDVFNAINKSWPHPSHKLMSLGKPGGGLASMVESCMENMIREPVDVFLFELAITGGQRKQELVNLFVNNQQTKFKHDPLVIFTNFLSTKFPGYDNYAERGARETTEIAQQMGYPVFTTAPFQGAPEEEKYQYYGKDKLHPFAKSMPDFAQPLVDVIMAGVDKNSHCASFVEPGPTVSTNGLSWQCLQLGNLTRQIWQENNKYSQPADIHIEADKGWYNVTSVPQSRTAMKPGIQSDQRGAVLHIHLKKINVPMVQTRVSYLYTTGNFGSVRVSCETCSCTPFTVSGKMDLTFAKAMHLKEIELAEDSMVESIEHNFEVNITKTTHHIDECILAVEVLEPSFKLIEVAMAQR